MLMMENSGSHRLNDSFTHEIINSHPIESFITKIYPVCYVCINLTDQMSIFLCFKCTFGEKDEMGINT